MDLNLSAKKELLPRGRIQITGSKSESNRLLILQAHYPKLVLENLSNSDDTRVLSQALKQETGTVDIHHAGTAMRFLTAYFASKPGREVVLTGSERMQQRPIGILVDALKSMGADISYVANSGYPPLKINGKTLEGNSVSLPGDISSQYISALLLTAPVLKSGLTIDLETEPTSVPYLKMTLDLLSQLGIPNSFSGNTITVEPTPGISPITISVESDWSSASYFYSIAALGPLGTAIELSTFKNNSLQGDSRLAELYRPFGIETSYRNSSIFLKKTTLPLNHMVDFDLRDCPDLAQTITVTCLGMGMGCTLTGLHTLKIKETDRLVALENEITKFGASIAVTGDSLQLKPNERLHAGVSVSTYNDHRMAMAFAPLGLKTKLTVRDAEVVSKSYPDFWSDLASIGLDIIEC